MVGNPSRRWRATAFLGTSLLCDTKNWHEIRIFVNLFRSIQIYSDLFRSIQIYSDLFRSIQIYSDLFRSIQILKMTWCRSLVVETCRNRLDNGALLSFSHLLLYIPPFHFLGFELFSQLVGALSHDQCLGMCSLACLGACQLVDGEVSIYWLFN